METVIGYGNLRELRLAFPPEQLVAFHRSQSETSVQSPAADLRHALQHPLDFPALNQAITPDDRITIAVHPWLMEAAFLVGNAVKYFLETGIAAESITVLQAPGETSLKLTPHLAAETLEAITLLEHDPDNSREIAYLASTQDGERIYLNRALVEADLVLPLGTTTFNPYWGIRAGAEFLYPLFSDEPTQRRFREQQINYVAKQPWEPAIKEVQDVLWLLGVHFALMAVPGRKGKNAAYFAGTPAEVAMHATSLYRKAWQISRLQSAETILITWEKSPGELTWEEIANSLEMALPFVKPGGSIVLCCGDLSEEAQSAVATQKEAAPASRLEEMTEGLQLLLQQEDLNYTISTLQQYLPADALTAQHLAKAQTHTKIYAWLPIREEVMEDLNFIPLHSEKEVHRLLERPSTCLLMENAQYLFFEGPGKIEGGGSPR
ncbi:Hypothetical protein PBC10988_26260 [Planctomycetales bacterium 10988]|nr:Hypothetical protein PBC10988_26260 [Planctomycetales bacterium 10988]